MVSKTIAAALFVSWAVHDLEEIVGTRYWRNRTLPRLRARYPTVPQSVWRRAEVDTAQMAIAVGLVAVPVGVAAIRGIRTDARSPLFQAAVTAYGLHGVGHVAGSLLARDYTPGVLTSPLVVVPYAVWARRQLTRNGVWQPMSGRDIAVSLLAVPVIVVGAQGLARRLRRRSL